MRIYEWFGKNLHRMVEPSFRHYVRAGELKAAGMVWTEVLEPEEDNDRARLAAEILASAAYQTTMAKVRAFVHGNHAVAPAAPTQLTWAGTSRSAPI